MEKKKILITDSDLELIEQTLETVRRLGERYIQLELKLKQAEVISLDNAPGDIVTMNSKIRYKDMDTGEEKVRQIVFPEEVNITEGKVSILGALGTALIGHKVGDTVHTIYWKVPMGTKTLKILEVVCQPEAIGEIYA